MTDLLEIVRKSPCEPHPARFGRRNMLMNRDPFEGLPTGVPLEFGRDLTGPELRDDIAEAAVPGPRP